MTKMLKIGHRGAMGYEPENTLRSFRRALALGTDMIELDVRLCKSGDLVVVHDPTLNRTTNGHGLVSKKTLAQLRLLDAGQGEKIPSLPEAIQLIRRRAKINIELKGQNTGEPVGRLINEYAMNRDFSPSNFLVSSSRKAELYGFKRICSYRRVEIGLIIPSLTLGKLALAEKIDAKYLVVNRFLVRPNLIEKIHRAGRKIFVYTVNKKSEIAKFKARGVDGVISDFPDQI